MDTLIPARAMRPARAAALVSSAAAASGGRKSGSMFGLTRYIYAYMNIHVYIHIYR